MFDFYYVLSLFYVQEKHLNKVCFQRGKKGCWHAGKPYSAVTVNFIDAGN